MFAFLSSFIFFLVMSTTPTLFTFRLNSHLTMLALVSIVKAFIGEHIINDILYDIFVMCVFLTTFSMCKFVYNSALETTAKIWGLFFSSLLLLLTLVSLSVKGSLLGQEQDIAIGIWHLSLGVYVVSVTNLYAEVLSETI